MGMYGFAAAVPEQVVQQLPRQSAEESMALLEGEGSVNLDKMWHVAFALVDQLAAPLSFLDAATPAGAEDMGYGPVMSIDAVSTKALAARVIGLDDAVVEAAYGGLNLDGVYPGVFNDGEAHDEAITAFRALVDLMSRAAASDQAVIFAIT